jgi:hypothetical protein
MAFKNTVVGKILKGAGIALGVVGGVVVGGGVLKAATGGIGSLINNLPAQKPQSGLSAISEKAKALVSGLTYEQQQILSEAKADAKTSAQKLKLADRLMKAGLNQAEAYAKAGISKADTESTEFSEAIQTQKAGLGSGWVMWAALILGALFIIPKLLKRK